MAEGKVYEWTPVQPKVVPRTGEKTAEEKSWARFRFPLLVKEVGAVSHLSFHPTLHYVAVSAGPRIHAYEGRFPSSDPIKSFAKFKGNAYGVSFRSDGLLLVCGGEEGRVRVFDEKSKTMMKQFFGHSGPVRVSKFFPDKVTVLSGGDDGTVRKWDVATETQLFSTSFHTDYVRCGFVFKSTPSLCLTGGYDKKVIALDSRTEQTTFSIALDHPVEEILSYGQDTALAVANGNLVSIYDVRAVDRGVLATLSNHAKTVTCLSTSDEESRLLSGSVDQTVKVWNVASAEYECVLTQRYTSAVLCMGMAQSNLFFVVGMADGVVSMQHRPPHKADEQAGGSSASTVSSSSSVSSVNGEGAPGTAQRKSRVDYKPERGDFRVVSGARIYQGKADAFLRKFEYRKALDAVLEASGSTPSMIVALFSDLIDRRALDAALSGRDEKSLLPICEFLYKQINKPFYDEICIDVLDRLMELYSNVVSQSPLLGEQFRKIRRKLDDEIELQQQYVALSGQIETVSTTKRK